MLDLKFDFEAAKKLVEESFPPVVHAENDNRTEASFLDLREYTETTVELDPKLVADGAVSVCFEHATVENDFYIDRLPAPAPSFSFYFSLRNERGRIVILEEEEDKCESCGRFDILDIPQKFHAYCFKVNGKRCIKLAENTSVHQAHGFPSFGHIEDMALSILTENRKLLELYDMLPDIAIDNNFIK